MLIFESWGFLEYNKCNNYLWDIWILIYLVRLLIISFVIVNIKKYIKASIFIKIKVSSVCFLFFGVDINICILYKIWNKLRSLENYYEMLVF